MIKQLNKAFINKWDVFSEITKASFLLFLYKSIKNEQAMTCIPISKGAWI